MKSDHADSRFIELIHEHHGILHRISSVYASAPQDREDLYQEILLQSWRSFPSFSGRARFSTWLYRIALNTALLRLRKIKGQQRAILKTGTLTEQPDKIQADTDADVELLYLCIQKLTALDRAIILLYLERQTHEEIADITGLSRNNVSVRLVRIKDRLRELLHNKGYLEA